MGRKRTEIIIETERIILIRSRPDNSIHWCDCRASRSSTVEDSAQDAEQRDEPVRDSAQGQSSGECPGCGKRKA